MWKKIKKKKRNNSEAKSHFGQSVSALLSSLLSSVCVGEWVLKVNVLQCYSSRVSCSTVDRDGYTQAEHKAQTAQTKI